MRLCAFIRDAAIRHPIGAAFAYSALALLPMAAIALIAHPASWAGRALGAVFGLLICLAPVRLNPYRSAKENGWCVAGSACVGAIFPAMAVGWSAVEAYRAAEALGRLKLEAQPSRSV